MNEVFENCPLTNQDSKVLKEFFVGKSSSESHLGIDVSGSSVYSLSFGVVCGVGLEEDGCIAVTVQYDDFQCIRYCHLSVVADSIGIGDTIEYRDFIGNCERYVHLEYGVSTTISSNSIIRCGDTEYYKSDPLPLLESRTDMVYDYREDEDYKDLSNLPDTKLDEITQDVLDEFDGGAGNER